VYYQIRRRISKERVEKSVNEGEGEGEEYSLCVHSFSYLLDSWEEIA
jgi:hypothetical protein